MKRPKKTLQRPQHPLVGRAFHTQTDKLATQEQGVIIAEFDSGYFLVQLYDWIIGEPSTQHVRYISDFTDKHSNDVPVYRFFDTLGEANDYAERWKDRGKV